MSCSITPTNSPVFSPRVSSDVYITSPRSLLNFTFVRQIEGSECSSSSSSLVTPLKRKRPARITVPVVPMLGFGVEDVDGVDEAEVEGDGYSVYCKRGRRCMMEDRYSAVVGLQGDSNQALFGVFDGHGGAKAAEFAAKNMDKNIMDQVSRKCNEEIKEAIKDGYLMTDTEFLKEDVSGGTCCLTALIRQGYLVVSNAGDCRAVLSQGGIAEALTSDHRPSRKEERDRIESLGGYVNQCHGVWRIQGSLAVSRGIGDRNLKQWVIAEPETRILKINPETEFLILASDGLWEKVSNQEAVDVIRPFCVGVNKHERFRACKKLAELSIKRGCVDDISVMIIQLMRFM